MKTSGISLVGLLGLIFITLKLLGVVSWSWWWVTAPFWGPPVLLLTFGVALVLFTACVWVLAAISDMRKAK